MEYAMPWQIFRHHFKYVMYATTYVKNSYLVQSTREVRKLKYCLGAISETTWWPVSVYLYLSDQWLHNNWVNVRLL